MIHRILCTLSAFFFIKLSFAQTDTLFRFLDGNYKPVSEKESAYKSVCFITRLSEGNWSVQDYDPETGRIMARAFYSDSLLQNQGGPYETFYPSGKKKMKGYFQRNIKTGIWKVWHETGEIADSVVYNQEGIIQGIRKKWYADGRLRDSAAYDTNGVGYAQSWYASGIRSAEGQMINEERAGLWKFYQRSGIPASEETYVKDSVVAIRCFDARGKVQESDCVSEKDAVFPGDLKAWQRYIQNKVIGNYDELNKKAEPGTAIVFFVIDTTGKITETRIVNPTGGYLDEFALRTIRNAPRWIPAKQHNITVKAYRKQPITFMYTDD